MSQENTIKYRLPISHGNCFTWNINNLRNYSRQSSDFFQFGGYCFYICFKRSNGGFSSPVYKFNLCGRSISYRKNISFHYTIILRSKCGSQCHFAEGEIQTVETSVDKEILTEQVFPDWDHVFFFSWRENGACEASSQGVQTESEKTTNVLEKGTQTEDKQISPTRDLCTHDENEANMFLEILSKNFGNFYESKTDTDCILRVGETEFHVHRYILAARSEVFAAMFHHDTSDRRSGEVDIQDVDAGALSDVLYYIYAGKIRGLSSDTATWLYMVADKYALMELREKCLDFLMHNLTVENVCDAARLAHTHAEVKLENKVIEFIKERLDDLKENERWKLFLNTHSKLASNLLFSALISTKKTMAK